jgi:hypothetical protein
MKEVKNQGAQGDCLFVRVDKIPSDAKVVQEGGRIIVAHSETGHHHAIDALGRDVVMHRVERDPFTCYLQIATDHADVVHHRPFDTHETLRLGQGIWMARRQREYSPAGWRMVQD